MLAIPFRLVFDLSPELAEGRIVETLAEPLGSREPFQSQVLDTEALMLRDQVGRQLVEEVLSSVGDLLMDAGDSCLRLAVPLRSLDAPGGMTLGPLQSLL